MQRVFLALGLSLMGFMGAFSVHAAPPELPLHVRLVNDFAGVLSPSAKNSIESELVDFNASTTNEVAVVTVQSLDGDYIEHYAAQLFQEWGIGTKKNDNGVLLLLAIKDRKLRIEVGYGLEGALPDSTAASIIADMTTLLKQNNYDGAVVLGVREIEQATKGEYVGTGATANTNTISSARLKAITTSIVVIIFLLQWLVAILARSKSYWAGGVLGGVAGLTLATIFGWWLLWGVGITALLFLIGLLLDLVVSRVRTTSRSLGMPSPWWAGGNFGGSSSGGFGGFGGGSSGGGGASGGW